MKPFRRVVLATLMGAFACSSSTPTPTSPTALEGALTAVRPDRATRIIKLSRVTDFKCACDSIETPVGQRGYTSFRITNAGNTDLHINTGAWSTTAPEVAVNGWDFPGPLDTTHAIPPGQSATIQLEFIPTAPGVVRGTVTASSDATGGKNTYTYEFIPAHNWHFLKQSIKPLDALPFDAPLGFNLSKSDL